MDRQHHAPPPVKQPVVATLPEARKMAEALMDVMKALLEIIENETEFVRAGNIREAVRLEAKKNELSQRYALAISGLKANQAYFKQFAPDLLAALQRNHEVFRSMLQVNLTVLATAHAVSEGVVRGVSAELQRKASPSTYNASGYRNAVNPNRVSPLTVSRSL